MQNGTHSDAIVDNKIVSEENLPVGMLLQFMSPIGHAEVRAAISALRSNLAEERATKAETQLREISSKQGD